MSAAVIEAACLLLFVLLVFKRPKFSFFLSLAVALLVAKNVYNTTETTDVRGNDLVGGRFNQTAALFAPGEKHDVSVSTTVPIPATHGENELLLKVTAAGLNPSNFKMNPAKIPFLRHVWTLPIVGYDVAGVAKSVGKGESCRGLKAGDRIFGFASGINRGSICEYAVVSCDKAAMSPDVLSDKEAAGLPVVALTSLEAWRRGGLTKGMRVLVIGASGGCGIFGVSIAKVLGAHVTGICSTRNVDFVKKFDTDKIVDYTSEEEMAALIAEGKQFDIIYDTVSSFAPEDPNYEPSMAPLLKQGGKYVAINGHPLDWIRGILDKFVFRPLSGRIGLVQRENYDLFLLTPTREMLESLASWFNKRQLKFAPIDSEYTLDVSGVHKAFDRMKSRRAVGKVVFKISE